MPTQHLFSKSIQYSERGKNAQVGEAAAAGQVSLNGNKEPNILSTKQKHHLLKTQKKKHAPKGLFLFDINFGSLPNTRISHKKNIYCCRILPLVPKNMKALHRS